MQISQHRTDLDSGTVSDVVILLELIFHDKSRHLQRQDRLENLRLMYKYLQFRCNLGTFNNSSVFLCYGKKILSFPFLYEDAKSWEDLENVIMPSVSKQRKITVLEVEVNGILSSQLESQNQELAKYFFFFCMCWNASYLMKYSQICSKIWKWKSSNFIFRENT